MTIPLPERDAPDSVFLVKLLENILQCCADLDHLAREWRCADVQLEAIRARPPEAVKPDDADNIKEAERLSQQQWEQIYRYHAKLMEVGYLAVILAKKIELSACDLTRAVAVSSPWDTIEVRGAATLLRSRALLRAATESEMTPFAPETCPVRLNGPKSHPLVFGASHDPLSDKEYKLVAKMVDAWPKGVSKSALEQVCSSPNKVLKQLKKRGGHWPIALCFPRARGRGGYRLAGPDPSELSTIAP